MSREVHQLTDLQIEIMDVFWSRGEATVADVHRALEPRHPLARKTVGTLLTRLESRGVLAHREVGREYVFRATVAREDVVRAAVDNLLRRLFAGDLTAMVSHALVSDEVDPGDVERLRRMLDDWDAEREEP